MYGLKQIAAELLATAQGDAYHGNALRVAKDIPGTTDEVRLLLDACMTRGIDFNMRMRLHDLAIRISHATADLPAVADTARRDVGFDFDAAIAPHILRNWSRDRIVEFAKHLLGDECQDCPKPNASVSIPDDKLVYATRDCSALTALLASIRECEQERLSAQMSGLDTGWEHPATQSMWRRVQALAEIVMPQNAKGDSLPPRKENHEH